MHVCVPSCPSDNSPKGECLDAPINRTPSDPTCSLSPRSRRRGPDTRGWVLSGVTRARHSLLSMWGAYISLSDISMTLGPCRSEEPLRPSKGDRKKSEFDSQTSKRIFFSLYLEQPSCTYILLSF